MSPKYLFDMRRSVSKEQHRDLKCTNVSFTLFIPAGKPRNLWWLNSARELLGELDARGVRRSHKSFYSLENNKKNGSFQLFDDLYT